MQFFWTFRSVSEWKKKQDDWSSRNELEIYFWLSLLSFIICSIHSFFSMISLNTLTQFISYPRDIFHFTYYSLRGLFEFTPTPLFIILLFDLILLISEIDAYKTLKLFKTLSFVWTHSNTKWSYKTTQIPAKILFLQKEAVLPYWPLRNFTETGLRPLSYSPFWFSGRHVSYLIVKSFKQSFALARSRLILNNISASL